MNLFETIDLMLLRNILRVPKSTPKEMLYLELGCLPYKEMIQKRRLMFLYHILHEKPESIVYRFLETQVKKPTSKDWVTTVLEDLKDLNLDVTFADIKVMKLGSFKNMLKQNIEQKALDVLEEKKSTHSKVKHLKHGFLKMQKYLKPSNMQISKEERHLIFSLRSGVTDVKINFKGMHESFECEMCDGNEETQKHILKCTRLMKMNKNI